MANENLLSNDLVEELQGLLDELQGDEVMDAGVADGFLTAAALNPEHPSTADIFPYIFSESGDPAALPENDRILQLLDVRLNEIKAALAARGGLDPVIFPLVDENDEVITDEEGIEALEPWATGFAIGMQLWPDSLSDSNELNEAAAPILRNLDPEAFDNPEEAEELIAEYDGETPSNLEDALYDLVKAVFDIKQLIDPNKPIVRDTPRVGRNDPCPCGSGKKFKQCCGKN